jgi:hypothetical protein
MRSTLGRARNPKREPAAELIPLRPSRLRLSAFPTRRRSGDAGEQDEKQPSIVMADRRVSAEWSMNKLGPARGPASPQKGRT